MGNITKLPNTKEFTMGGLTLSLRLDAAARLNIEDALDEGIESLFMKGQGEAKLPSTKKMLLVLQGANKTSGITGQMIKKAFIKFVDEENGSPMEIMGVVSDLLNESGSLNSKKDEETDGESQLSLDNL